MLLRMGICWIRHEVVFEESEENWRKRTGKVEEKLGDKGKKNEGK